MAQFARKLCVLYDRISQGNLMRRELLYKNGQF